MSRNNNAKKNKEKPSAERTDVPILREVPKTDDAFKFLSFVIRNAISAVTGRSFGDSSFDHALGNSLGQMVSSKELCELGKPQAIAIHAACGAWEVVKDGS